MEPGGAVELLPGCPMSDPAVGSVAEVHIVTLTIDLP
jgi:hypothetical protein